MKTLLFTSLFALASAPAFAQVPFGGDESPSFGMCYTGYNCDGGQLGIRTFSNCQQANGNSWMSQANNACRRYGSFNRNVYSPKRNQLP